MVAGSVRAGRTQDNREDAMFIRSMVLESFYRPNTDSQTATAKAILHFT